MPDSLEDQHQSHPPMHRSHKISVKLTGKSSIPAMLRRWMALVDVHDPNQWNRILDFLPTTDESPHRLQHSPLPILRLRKESDEAYNKWVHHTEVVRGLRLIGDQRVSPQWSPHTETGPLPNDAAGPVDITSGRWDPRLCPPVSPRMESVFFADLVPSRMPWRRAPKRIVHIPGTENPEAGAKELCPYCGRAEPDTAASHQIGATPESSVPARDNLDVCVHENVLEFDVRSLDVQKGIMPQMLGCLEQTFRLSGCGHLG